MTTTDTTDTCRARGAAATALLDLVLCLPVTWVWAEESVPDLRLLVGDGAGSEKIWVRVVGGWYVADVEPGAEPVRLAEVGPAGGFARPGEACEALGRIFDAAALVAEFADLGLLGGDA